MCCFEVKLVISKFTKSIQVTRRNVKIYNFFSNTKKKLVTRLPNFPDRRIRYGSFFSKKYRHKQKNIFRILLIFLR